jgi:hypothetical protein
MHELGLPQGNAFISYSHEDAEYAGQAKRVLAEVSINAFLAHEDLNVSEQWRERILEELRRCDLFVALFSAHFLSSIWGLQEVGFIVARPEVMVAPLSIDGTVPCGFVSHLQSRRIPRDGISRALLVEPLAAHRPRMILPGLIRIAGDAGGYREAEARMRPLVPLFPIFTTAEAEALASASVSNGQIWGAQRCRGEYLPELIRVQGANLKPETLRALQYQVENDEWYGRRTLTLRDGG